jgi:uncharacterized repeat protein (TIGR01451 family)
MYTIRFSGRFLCAAAAAAAIPLATSAVGHAQAERRATSGRPMIGREVHRDISPNLRDIPPKPYVGKKEEREANRNPRAVSQHKNAPDTVVQSSLADAAMPAAGLNFNGIPFPGVNCNCAPPDTNGEVGATQYVQIVNEGLQVFDKTSTASLMGPVGIATLWSGFGGVCETNGSGDPVVLYDQLANRWVVSQFAGNPPTDECVAVSQTSDATGAYFRYDFHLGSNFFDYPKLAVWPDAYYMAMNVFNSTGTAYLGPQPFAFNRAAMLTGASAAFYTPGVTNGSSEEPYLPADLDGNTLPPAGAPNTFIEYPSPDPNNAGADRYKLFHFHVDWTTPANSSFTLFNTLPVAGYTDLCPATRSCVPQAGTTSRLDGIGDRLMFRAAYRNFGDHESLVTNYSVNSSSVAGVRWLEIRNVTNGPASVNQESTYQPDSTWRWMGSAAMDTDGNLAIGFSASSGSIFPQLRYAGRLSTDPLNQLSQGESTLFSGTGSQTGTSSRWGDYSALTIDPVDDCTFWFTSEYYSTTSSFNWRTRIGTFRFPSCSLTQGTLRGQVTSSAAGHPTIQGVTVQVGNSSTTTNATGDYSIDVPVGTYSVTFSKSGYASKTVQNVAVTNASPTTLDAVLDPTPVLQITKNADATAINYGSPIGFSVSLINSGVGDATGVTVTDNLPAGAGINWQIDTVNSSPGWSVVGTPPTQSLAYSQSVIAAGTSTAVHVFSTTTSQSCGTYTNTASFTSANAGSGSTNPVSSVVRCALPLITTSNQCTAYTNNTAPSLSTLLYTVKGNRIGNISPSSFFYWVRVAASAGANTVVISQTITTGNFSTQFQRGTSNVYTAGCGTGLSPTFSQSSLNSANGTITVNFTAPSTGVYIIGLQLNTNSARNDQVPNPTSVHYDFAVNGLPGSTAGINLNRQ